MPGWGLLRKIQGEIVMRPIALLAAALALAGLALAGPHEDAMMQADRDFNAMAQKDGVVAAFKFYAAPDARMFRREETPVKGPDEIAVLMAEDYAAGGALTWEPREASASDDGTAGYTHGRWKYVSEPDKDGKVTTLVGTYITVWRRQPDGSLKFVADLGTPDAKQPGAP